MSEPIELESDNICSTEDAFEEFQCVSMSAQQKYIKLSDLVSPQSSPCDYNSDKSNEKDCDDSKKADTSAKTDKDINIDIPSPTQQVGNLKNSGSSKTLNTFINKAVESDIQVGSRRLSKADSTIGGSTVQESQTVLNYCNKSNQQITESENVICDKNRSVIVGKKRGRKPKQKIMGTRKPSSPPQTYLQEDILSTNMLSNQTEDEESLEINKNHHNRPSKDKIFETNQTTTSEADSTNNIEMSAECTNSSNDLKMKICPKAKEKIFPSHSYKDLTTQLSNQDIRNQHNSSKVELIRRKRGRPKRGRPKKTHDDKIVNTTTNVDKNQSEVIIDDLPILHNTMLKKSITGSDDKFELQSSDEPEAPVIKSQIITLNDEDVNMSENERKKSHLNSVTENQDSDGDDEISLLSLKSFAAQQLLENRDILSPINKPDDQEQSNSTKVDTIKKKRGRPKKIYENKMINKSLNVDKNQSEATNHVLLIAQNSTVLKTPIISEDNLEFKSSDIVKSQVLLPPIITLNDEDEISTDIEQKNCSKETITESQISDDDEISLMCLKSYAPKQLLDNTDITTPLSTPDNQEQCNSSNVEPIKKKRGRPKKNYEKKTTSRSPNVDKNQSQEINDGLQIVQSPTVPKTSTTYSENKEPSNKSETQVTESQVITLNDEDENIQSYISENEQKNCFIETENQISNNDEICMLPLNSNNTNIDTSKSDTTKILLESEKSVNNVTNESCVPNSDEAEQPLVNDTSGRPVRRVIRKPIQYDEESDEDPFANVELSDDDLTNGKKNRYYSDDEYIPHGTKKRKGKAITESDSSDSEIMDEIKKKKSSKLLDGPSPKKRGRKSKAEKSAAEACNEQNKYCNVRIGDTNECLESSINQFHDDNDNNETLCELKSSSATDEFESFLAKKIKGTSLKIKKLSTSDMTDNALTTLQIPVLDPKEIKKSIDTSSQTETALTKSAAVQTCHRYNLPMKANVSLSEGQSVKACEFLSNIVNTTVELGQLMTQKSEDFIKRKINVENVTDTLKMDYCVKKSFLLFKLAKHNLTQMEEDLATQYNTFLKEQNLSWVREEEKEITASTKVSDDSDCEIVEEIVQPTKEVKKTKPLFNPKTVFLNKELSIKIAKKPEEKKKIPIKGRNTLWISNTVLLKKVKPSQSFLAQDSRNKKPPDQNYVTKKMVSDFFLNYYYKKIYEVCNAVASMNWINVNTSCECYHFVTGINFSAASCVNESEDITTISSTSLDMIEEPSPKKFNPETLFKLCTQVLQKQLHGADNHLTLAESKKFQNLRQCDSCENPKTLFWCCMDLLQKCLKKNNSSDLNNANYCTAKLVHETDLSKEKRLGHEVVFNKIKKPQSLLQCSLQVLLDTSNNNLGSKEAFLMNKSTTNGLNFVMKIENINNFSNAEQMYRPKTLLSFSLIALQKDMVGYLQNQNTAIHPDPERDKIHFYGLQYAWSTPKTLFKLCIEKLENKYNKSDDYNNKIVNNLQTKIEMKNALSLKSICYNVIVKILQPIDSTPQETDLTSTKQDVKSLFSLCVEYIQQIQKREQRKHNIDFDEVPSGNPNELKQIAFLNLCRTFFSDKSLELENMNDQVEAFTINSINTLSEEAYFNIERTLDVRNSEYTDDSDIYDDATEFDLNEIEENNLNDEENNWVTHVQMQELRSCFPTASPDQTACNESNIQPVFAQIKLEPEDENTENIDISIVKTESVHNPDEMTIIPESIISKSELIEAPDTEEDVEINRTNRSSYDVNLFESFVSNNELTQAVNEKADSIFSQSDLKVQRHHEPDYDQECDTNNSLLIPQTYETIKIGNAKNSLMESSSDEGPSSKKAPNKKKLDKRRAKQKKVDPKSVNKEKISKGKDKLNSEVDTFTRKMREKIRQNQKKNDISDSESDIPLDIRKIKSDKKKSNIEKNNIDETKQSTNKVPEVEIQCNNVDSTQQFQDNNESSQEPTEIDSFIGFSANELNETTEFQKYLKYLYDKLIPNIADEKKLGTSVITQIENKRSSVTQIESEQPNDRPETPLINYEDPAEEVQCEPSLHIFNDFMEDFQKTNDNNPDMLNSACKYTERNGWQCYPINVKDTKLYQQTQIILDKLPESFVNVYFQYQEIASKDNQDREIDRLTDLTSLNRIPKEMTTKSRPRSKESKHEKNQQNVSSDARLPHLEQHELSPSDDDVDADDSIAPAMPTRNVENNIAKDSLMNDSGDEDKTECIEEEPEHISVPKRPGPKSKTVPESKAEKSIMLTADKVMNKELNLLNTPAVIQEEPIATTRKGPVTRNKSNPKPKSSPNQRGVATKEDSSSEEEKLWVNTKEKLLKRLEKKDNASVEDAKRAKLVNEFIERRGDGLDSRKRTRNPRYRKSKKFLLEREKQLKTLSKELYGEAEGGPSGKGCGNHLFKGRRNIRKVIDKKSLTHRTVLANVEELERKRRLLARQTRLREHLGCEEDVNVMVINDEVCLEYDFEENRPVVTIHPFFTKVMKAHQYEGVKFMWDACFESVEHIAAGKPGSGCILAHCMGLGKTLQVLALLHTVLTHPGVGIQRVLVCCPLSTVLNWVDEIHKWIGPVTNQIKPRKLRKKLQVFELSKLKKTYERAYQLEDWYSGGGIFIIGYELFRSLSTLDPELDDIRPTIVNKIRTALLDPGPDIIVCDEGHLLKNDCSVLAVAMSRVATRRRIVLTGTPMQNNLREYFCMVNFVKPNLLGTYSEFSNRFENPIMNGQHRDSRQEDIRLMKARTHILHKVLEGCLQRQEASVLYPYLPKKHEYTVFIALTQCQWDLYKHYLLHYGKQTKNSILKDFHILQKIWSHPQVLHIFQTKARDEKAKIKAEKLEDDLAHEDITSEDIKPAETEVWWLQYLDGGKMLDSLESSNKFAAVFQILEECTALGDKVLIFSTSLFTLDALEYFLRKIKNWSLGHDYYRLDGSVPPEVRQKWCREFNAENNIKTKLFLISTRAGSLGLNMTAANRVIILDTSWNPAHDIQSIFRVYRFGQRKDCYIYRFVAMGTMEQKIYERSVTKQAVACRVVDEQQIERHYNSAELTELYRFDETGASVAGGVAVGVQDVALLRLARDAAIHAVHEHDSLLRGSTEPGLPEHERAAAWMQFQQEHAHKQMQNELAANNTRISSKLQGHEYAKSPVPQPSPRKDEAPKTKRGKKNSAVPPQDSAAESSIQGSLINEIRNILINHNFQISKSEDLLNFVNKVRMIVSTGSPSDDAVAMSVAGLLLQQRWMAMPVAIAMVCEAIKRRVVEEGLKQTHVVGPDATPPDVTPPDATPPDAPQTSAAQRQDASVGSRRTKRKAAIAAERHLDMIVPNLLDDDSDLDTEPAYTEPAHTNPTRKTEQKSGKKIKMTTTIDMEPANSARDNIEMHRSSTVEREPVNTVANIPTAPPKDAEVVDLDSEPQNDTPDVIVDSDEGVEVNSVISNRPKRTTTSERSRKNKNAKSNNKETDNDTYSILIENDSELAKDPQHGAPRPHDTSAERPIKIKKVAQIDVELVSNAEPEAAIALSDDDEPIVKTNKITYTPKTSKKKKPQGKINLPPLLLTNENFIKIVAHTYLSGNPKLDRDAALLAAQYSTLKALKEVEATGKLLDSGPIYDIAVKELGVELLTKLHGTMSKPTRSAEYSAASLLKKSLMNIENQIKEDAANEPTVRTHEHPPPPPHPPRVPPLIIQRNKKTGLNTAINGHPKGSLEQKDDSNVEKLSQHEPRKHVVPIRMYQRPTAPAPATVHTTLTSDECILPDDDDVIISDILPAVSCPAPTPSTQTSSANKVVAGTSRDYSTATGLPQYLGRPDHPRIPEDNQAAVVNTERAASTQGPADCICLDSDDDEGPAPPHPVSISYTPPVPAPQRSDGPPQYITGDTKRTPKPPAAETIAAANPTAPPVVLTYGRNRKSLSLAVKTAAPPIAAVPPTHVSVSEPPRTADVVSPVDKVKSQEPRAPAPAEAPPEPMSMFKNVVHIMAHDAHPLSKPEPSHKAANRLQTVKLLPVKKLRAQIDAPIASSSKTCEWNAQPKAKRAPKSNRPADNRTVINLTELGPVSSVTAPSKHTTSASTSKLPLSKSVTIVSKPSNIALHKKTICLIAPKMMTIKTVNDNKKRPSILTKVKPVLATKLVMKDVKTKKRTIPSPPQQPAKKRKVNEMSLEDFDIDNIDDIIELD
uniref:Uncharacterized protein n=1 Tax=Bombyx mori TaxID=7091 RepID=A0A8R2DNM7_BOMMO|nr:uncharacterized protein LOC101739897 isoform X1 [Bombyx mori]